jgi:hypothetical protein
LLLPKPVAMLILHWYVAGGRFVLRSFFIKYELLWLKLNILLAQERLKTFIVTKKLGVWLRQQCEEVVVLQNHLPREPGLF